MNRSTTIVLLIATLITISAKSNAQDIYFSQHYADKLSLNLAHPAITGNNEISVIMRQQFPQAQGGFKTYSASYLQQFGQCGIGIRAYGTGGKSAYKQNQIGITWANMIQLSKKIRCAAAIEVSYTNKKLKQNELVYYSMIDPISGNITNAPPLIEYTPTSNIALSTGIIIYTKKTAAGIAAYNIAQYKISDNKSIPKAFTAFANHKIELKKTLKNHQTEPTYLIPNIIIRHQNNITNTQIGLNIETPIIIGGIAYRIQTGEYTQHIIIPTIGITIKKIQIGYGHDFNLSNTIKADYGSHEIAIKYLLNNNKKNNNNKTIFCPAF